MNEFHGQNKSFTPLPQGGQRQSASNNEAWTHVERISMDRWRCPYCSNSYSIKVLRVEAHLGAVRGLGIAICEGNVPPDVRARMALAANRKIENKKRKYIAASDDPLDSALEFLNSNLIDNLLQFDHPNSVFGSGSPALNPNGAVGSGSSSLAGQQPLLNKFSMGMPFEGSTLGGIWGSTLDDIYLGATFVSGSYPLNPSGEAGNSSSNSTLQQPPPDYGLSMELSGEGISTQQSSLCEIEGPNLVVLRDAGSKGSNSTSLLTPDSLKAYDIIYQALCEKEFILKKRQEHLEWMNDSVVKVLRKTNNWLKKVVHVKERSHDLIKKVAKPMSSWSRIQLLETTEGPRKEAEELTKGRRVRCIWVKKVVGFLNCRLRSPLKDDSITA